MPNRQPPHSPEAERAVLGAVLIDFEKVIDLCVHHKLTLEAFYVPANRLIFAEMGNMTAKHRAIDAMTVADGLRLKGELERVGGMEYLNGLIDDTTVSHAEHYIEIIRKAWMRRQMIQIANTAAEEAYEAEEPEELRSKTEAAFTNMQRRQEAADVRSVFDDVDRDVNDALAGKEIETAIPTGYAALDNLNEGGMRKGGVYWLSGEWATGKTSLKCNIILNLIAAGYPVGSLTLEMTIREEIERMASIEIDCSVPRIIRGLQRPRPDSMNEARKLIVESDLFHIADRSNVGNVLEFWSWARRMVTKFGKRVLFVDPFQNLRVPDQRKMSLEEKTSAKAEVLDDVAGELQVPIIAVAMKNKQGTIRGSEEADYTGAGHWQLSRDVDRRPQPPQYEQEIILFTKKARFGIPFASVPFTFYGRTGRFTEASTGGTNDRQQPFTEFGDRTPDD